MTGEEIQALSFNGRQGGRQGGGEGEGEGLFMPAAGRRRRMPELPRGSSCVGRSTPGAE